jgi:hypothetical protein
METGVTGNTLLLRLRKVTATLRQLKASHSLTHSESHQAQNTGKHTGVKQRRAWTKEEIREVIPCYICIAGSILQKITRKCMKYGDNVT